MCISNILHYIVTYYTVTLVSTLHSSVKDYALVSVGMVQTKFAIVCAHVYNVHGQHCLGSAC